MRRLEMWETHSLIHETLHIQSVEVLPKWLGHLMTEQLFIKHMHEYMICWEQRVKELQNYITYI